VELPFELQQHHQPSEPTHQELLMERTSKKLIAVLSLIISRVRSRQKLFDILARVHDILLSHSTESEVHHRKYKEMLTRAVKIKSMMKEISVDEFKGLVCRELTDLLLANVLATTQK
jgi:hypothetical protein